MKETKLYSVRSSEDEEKPFESICGFVKESDTQFHAKSASLKIIVNGEEFWVANSEVGVPTVNVGDKVILYLSRIKERRKYLLAMQIYQSDVLRPVVRASFRFDDYLEFR